MSGPQLAQRLLLVRPELKVLYMSGYTNDAVLRHGVIDSAFAFLQKPLTPGLLARKLRDVLDAPSDAETSSGIMRVARTISAEF
jgi:DNA-binding NtrC family response regulator